MAARQSIWAVLLAPLALGSDIEPPMLPPERMEGVVVLAFEEQSYFPGATTRPDANDPWRYNTELLIEREELFRLFEAGGHPHGTAFHLTFIGSRTREPSYGCDGVPYYLYEAKQLLAVRNLGPMGKYDFAGMPERRQMLGARLRGTGGAAQAKGIADCNARRSDPEG